MVEGKKNLPREAETETCPIDVEAMLTKSGLYEELEKTKSAIEIMRCVYEARNIAYSLGKDGKPMDPHRFKEIDSTTVAKMKWDMLIDPDTDGFHETMKILSQELNFYYERRECQ